MPNRHSTSSKPAATTSAAAAASTSAAAKPAATRTARPLPTDLLALRTKLAANMEQIKGAVSSIKEFEAKIEKYGKGTREAKKWEKKRANMAEHRDNAGTQRGKLLRRVEQLEAEVEGKEEEEAKGVVMRLVEEAMGKKVERVEGARSDEGLCGGDDGDDDDDDNDDKMSITTMEDWQRGIYRVKHRTSCFF
ncbi:hypothetical protein MMC13_004965 [Lambiella insularis]|nr:hypothetical protein [Lambiella insularis]